jgi:hypothetical protein
VVKKAPDPGYGSAALVICEPVSCWMFCTQNYINNFIDVLEKKKNCPGSLLVDAFLGAGGLVGYLEDVVAVHQRVHHEHELNCSRNR